MNVTIIWDDENDLLGNAAHIAEHGFTVDDVEFVLECASSEGVSKSSGRPCVFGRTPAGEHVIVIFEQVDDTTIYPVTCYEVPEKEEAPMIKRKIAKRAVRNEPVTVQEAARLDEIRRLAMKDFPPAKNPRLQLAQDGIAAEIRQSREAQGLTWYAVAKRAGIPHPGTVRDIEYGRDVKLSNLQAVAKALGLKLELVEA